MRLALKTKPNNTNGAEARVLGCYKYKAEEWSKWHVIDVYGIEKLNRRT